MSNAPLFLHYVTYRTYRCNSYQVAKILIGINFVALLDEILYKFSVSLPQIDENKILL